MMIKLEKDSSLIYTVNHEEYAKFITDLQTSTRHEIAELTQDFLNLQLHPNTRDLAGLASLVNGEKEKGGVDLSKQSWLLEYVLLCRAASEKTGYRGAIFYRKENSERHGQLIIAHGGTKFEPGDWQADYDGVVNNRLTPQINSACTFGLHFVQKFSTQIPHHPGGNVIQLSITGHSLGGWLAQICTFALKYLHLNETTFDLNSQNFHHPHCEVFDSPGAFEIIQGLSSLKQFRVLKLKTKPNFGLDIANFVFTPNGVNVVNNHIGDMFLLPLDHSIVTGSGGKPSSFLTRQNFTFTKTTHAMALFVGELQSNSNPRLVRVEEWILILFRNWDTKKHVYLDKHVNLLSLFGSSVKHLFTTKWSQTTKEYDDHMKSGLPVGTTSMGESLAINLHTLSAGAQEVVELLKTIAIWQTYHEGNGGNSNLEILQGLVEIVAKSPTRNPILLPSQNYFEMLQNAGLAVTRIAEMCGKLENFSVAQIRSCSDRYRDAIKEKFISLEFDEGKESIIWRDEYRHGNKNLLKLFCLKICALIESEKGGLSRKNALIFKYRDVNFTNLVSPPDGVEFIFVDCINHKIEQKPNIIPGCQVIFVTHDPTVETSNNNGWSNLCIAESSFPAILTQSINLQGVLVQLSELLNSESGCQEILQCLFNDPDKLYVVLQKSAKLDIGILPASIFDNINIYVEPEQTFNSIEEAVQIFKEGLELSRVILFYGEDGFPDFGKFVQNSLQNSDLKYFILTSDEDPVASFQQYCKDHSDMVVELVACRIQGNLFDWKLHYNPDLYRTREILPPALDTRGLHKGGAGNPPVNFKIAAGPGAETWEEVLSINCALIPDKDSLLDNLGLSQVSGVDPAMIKSVNLKPGIGGSCELVLHFSVDTQPALVVQLPGKQSVHENNIVSEGGDIKRLLMCISDSPGMGKSFTMMTICTKILQNYLQNNSWAWVFFIQLRDLTGFDRLSKALLTRPDEDNVPETYLELDSIVPFLAQNLKLDSISSIAFRAMMMGSNSSKIFLILDGFDELANSNKQLVSRVLKGLRINSSVNIAVSTRTRDNLLVETSLGIISHHLLPLGQYEQFLYDIWRGVIRDGNKDRRLATYSSTLMRKVQDSFVTDNSNSFLGIPLHMKMLSVAFATPARNFCTGLINLDQAVPSQYSLRILIDQFIDTKYKIFFLNKLGLKDGAIWEDLRPRLIWNFERELEFLGGDMLEIGADGWDALIWEIYRVERKNLQISPDDPSSREIYRIGLVQGSPKPEFLHRSIAESYVTNFIFESFKQFCLNERRHGGGENDNNFAQKLFVVGKSAVLEIGRRLIRSFLNELVKNDDQILSQLRDGTLPRIATRGVDDDILSCFYELVRLEHSSTELFGFLAHTFFNWGQTSRYILVLFALSGLSVIPMTETTLEIVLLLIRSFRLQIGENSIAQIMESEPCETNEFAIIKRILLYPPENLEWYRFRADFKPFLLNKESAMSQFAAISKAVLGKEEVKVRLEERYGICGDEFETSVKFVDWLLEFMQILGKDLRLEMSRSNA